MDLLRVPDGGYAVIQAYGDNGFRIAGQRIEGAVLVRRDGAEAVALSAIEDIGPLHMERLAAFPETPELLLIGTGGGPVPLPAAVRAVLARAGIAVEVMATGAACRTYNVLVAEGRRVAAILLPVP